MVWRSALSASLCALLIAAPVPAHETDQFTVPAGKRFADLGEFFNAVVYETVERGVKRTNEKIRRAMEADRGPGYVAYLQSPEVLGRNVWGEFSSAFFLIEHYEKLVHNESFMKRYPGRVVGYRQTIRNIYQHVHFPLDPRQFFRLWHASTMQVYGVYMGPDKLGHFTDMGHKYFKAYRRALKAGADRQEAFRRAVEVGTKGLLFSESGMVGYGSAGAYSNADLAANYAGFKFYVNLTEPQRIKGVMQPPIVVLRDGLWRISPDDRRELPFFELFVSDHFNEALNPSLFERGMRPAVRAAVAARADKILLWYADDNGNRRPRRYFEAMLGELSTYYGEDYGHRGSPDELVSIANTCYGHSSRRRDDGYTPLHRAAQAGDMDAASRLLDEGAAVDQPVQSLERGSDEWGSTPLHVAAAAGNLEMGRLLLERGADAGTPNDNGATPLHRGLADPQIVALLLEHGADPDARDRQGRAPLHWLARYPDPASTRLLLEAGAPPDARDHDGRTPLHRAAMWGHTAMMSDLLDAGASVAARARYRTTALHFAACQDDPAVARLLLDRGARVDAADEFGLTPLHMAARRGSLPIVVALLAGGADPNATDAGGTTALHLAVRGAHRTVAVVLMDSGADVNLANGAGAVPLHDAVFAGRTGLVDLLLDRGADATVRDAAGRSPRDAASDNSDAVAVLRMDRLSAGSAAEHGTMGMR